MQYELDAWSDRVNNSRKRADRNKILPHGVPNDIYQHPERFGCLDFKVCSQLELVYLFCIYKNYLQIGVEQAAIDHIRNTFAPPNDPVFELVPPEFGQYATILYQSMGSPAINSENVWNIYRELLHRFEHLDDAVNFMEECQVYLDVLDNQVYLDDEVPPAGLDLYGGPDNQDADGNYYMGGVNNGRGLGM